MPGKGGKKGFGSRIINYIKTEVKQAKENIFVFVCYFTELQQKRDRVHNTWC